jgi:hypothetical protein
VCLAKPSSGGIWDAREPPRWGHPNATSGQLDHLPASVRWSSLAGPSRPRWLWFRRGLNGPQRWSTVRRHDRRGRSRSYCRPTVLIGDASLGWNPSVRSTIQHASRISNRVLLDAQRHQQTQATNKQPTGTSRTRQPTWRKLWGRTVSPCNLNPQQRDLTPVCVHR